MSVQLMNESGGFSPTRKYHLVPDRTAAALCGATPSMSLAWNVTADRAEFERLCPDRICKRCVAAETPAVDAPIRVFLPRRIARFDMPARRPLLDANSDNPLEATIARARAIGTELVASDEEMDAINAANAAVYRDATYSAETQQTLRGLERWLDSGDCGPAGADYLPALRDVLNRWDDNDATETTL